MGQFAGRCGRPLLGCVAAAGVEAVVGIGGLVLERGSGQLGRDFEL